MSDYSTEQHFVVIKKEKESLRELLDREPYISIRQISTLQELGGEEMMDVWIRFGFEDPNIPNIPTELSYEQLKRLIDGYIDNARADGMRIEVYKNDVKTSMTHNQEKYIRQCMLEQSKYKERVAEVVLEGIEYGLSTLSSVPKLDDKQLKKILDFWGKTRYTKYDNKEYGIAQNNLDIDKLAEIYIGIAKEQNKSCDELPFLDSIMEYPEKYVALVIKEIIPMHGNTAEWLSKEKDRIKEILATE